MIIIKKLDIYILREFLKIFFIGMFVLIIIFILVDMIDFSDKLIKYQVTFQMLIRFYVLRIPSIIQYMFPPSLLMASLFSYSGLSNKSEIVAMRSSGISLNRIFVPVIIITFLITLGMVWFSVFVVPDSEYAWERMKKYEIYKRKPKDFHPTQDLFFKDAQNRFFFIHYYHPKRKMASNVVITTLKDQAVTMRITASQATITDSSWLFKNYLYTRFDSLGNILQFKNQNLYEDTSIRIDPIYFQKPVKDIREMNHHELLDRIDILKHGGQIFNKPLTIYFSRFTFPLSGFISVLFGAPLGITHFRRKKTSISFSISLFICFFYYVLIRVFQSFGYNNVLEPLWATTIPHAAFLFLGIVFILSSNK